MAVASDYCSFTKAVEHLGDRWSLVILRELTLFGSRGFNALVAGMPGVSRSVLAARLRHLERLGLVTAARGSNGRARDYRLADAGRQLEPVLRSLWRWSQRWLPEDPAMVERDPDILSAWLGQRIDPERLPERPVVLDLEIRGTRMGRFWLVLERGVEPSMCIEDPGLDPDRYVYVEGELSAMLPLARGTRGWGRAARDGSIVVSGDPRLVAALPRWFLAPGSGPSGTALAAQVG